MLPNKYKYVSLHEEFVIQYLKKKNNNIKIFVESLSTGKPYDSQSGNGWIYKVTSINWKMRDECGLLCRNTTEQ